MPQGDGAQSGSCPAAEPNASDPCTWPTDLQCQYRDPCGAFGCQDTFTCVAGHYLASVCGYALGCSAACGYALGCSAATPKNGDSCACGAGHSAHHPGEGFPCNFACAEGQLIATCDVKTEKWTVSGPAMCTPLADGGGPDAGDGECGERESIRRHFGTPWAQPDVRQAVYPPSGRADLGKFVGN